jgi:RHS repeat-associated protein
MEAAVVANTTTNRMYAPGETEVNHPLIDYDAAGNQKKDLYNAAAANRVYDAENRMTKETQAGGIDVGVYTYNADGQRVRRTVSGVEKWQVYGIGGEMVAEYSANGAILDKEYGYRNGQLLVTAESAAQIKWLVADNLGTPRIIVDKVGTLASVSRHDYLPFGEELLAGQGGRSLPNGHSGDNVRQKFTSKERDIETGLDYSINRYYSNLQGRFTSVDPLDESGERPQPQSWNRYSYAINNPLKFMDPDGLRYVQRKDGNGDTVYGWCATDKCYDAALEGGWSAVQFNESKPFEYTTVGGGGGDRYSKYRLNPDGTNGYADVLDGNYRAMSTDWNAQLAIGGLLKGLASILGEVMDSLGSAITSQAAQATTQAGATTAEQQIVKAAAGKITGFTKHGINQAISRDGVGVSTRAIAEAVKNPIKVVVERGATKYIGRDATVVLNKAGKVMTTWARNSAGKRGP